MSQQKIVLGRDFGHAVVSYLGLDGAKVAADIKMVVDMDEVFRVSIDCLLDADDLRGIADRMSAIENGKDAIPPSFEPDGLPGFWQEFSRKAIKEIGEIGAAVKQMAEQINVLTANGTATFDMPAPEQQEEEEPAQPEQPEALPLPDLQEVMRNPEKYIGREDCQLLVAEAARTSKKVRGMLDSRAP